MRRCLLPLLLLGLLGAIPSGLHADPPRYRTVIIDAGHGGKDEGASWYGIDEKVLTLKVAKLIEKKLKAKDIPSIMTRKDDTYVTLDGRAAIANKHPDSLFISIHFNAHSDKSVKGVETFYMSAEGKELADVIQGKIMSKIGTRDRGTKSGLYAVLTRTKYTAVLVEGGFISNPWECSRCNADWYQEILATAIVDAIVATR